MGLNIDEFYSADSVVNIAAIRSTLDNFHSLLLLYDEFDDSIDKLEILRCSRIFTECFSKLSDTFGVGFGDAEFRDRYTSVAMNTYTVFNSMYKDEEYLANALTQYFGHDPASSAYLDTLVSGSQDFAEIYENVLKDVSVNESSELADKMLKEFYKKLEIFVKVLYYLAYRSFQTLGSMSTSAFSVSLGHHLTKEISLGDLVESFSNLGIFGYFLDLFENYSNADLDFSLPSSVADKATQLSQEFNINLHLKLYAKDQEFSCLLKRALGSSFDATGTKLVQVDQYLKAVLDIYREADFTTNLHFEALNFDEAFLQDLFTRLVGTFYEGFCEAVSLLLPLVDVLDLVEAFRVTLQMNGLYSDVNYFDTYLSISLRNWENQLLEYVRSLSLNQYPALSNPGASGRDRLCTDEDYFLKPAGLETVIDAYNTFLAQFMAMSGAESTKNEFGLGENLRFLNSLQSCYISNNLYLIVILMAKLALIPAILNHELDKFAPESLRSPEGECKAPRTRIMTKYIEHNSKLTQNLVLLYVFNSNSSFKEFLYNICKLDRGDQGIQEILLVFIIYISNVYYINHVATLLPYLVQYSFSICARLVHASSDLGEIMDFVRSHYRISVIKISLLKLQDYLVVHLSAFSQQYVQKLVSSSLDMLHHTSSESYGNEVLSYLTTFAKLTSKYLPLEVYKNALNICVDLSYSCIIYEILCFFEAINYKFNQQLFMKIKIYVESISYSVQLHVLNSIELELVYAEKFHNFLKIFNYEYNAVQDHLYGQNEHGKINRLLRHLRTLWHNLP